MSLFYDPVVYTMAKLRGDGLPWAPRFKVTRHPRKTKKRLRRRFWYLALGRAQATMRGHLNAAIFSDGTEP